MTDTTVAIWGGCATRDIFAARPTPLQVVSYQGRTSWISQTTPPVPGAENQIGRPPANWEERMGIADAARTTLASIIAARPDILVFDLVTEALTRLYERGPFVVIEHQSGHKRPLMRAAAPDAVERLTYATDPDRPARFAAAVATLAPVIRAALPDTALVLHSCRAIAAFDAPDVPPGASIAGQAPVFDATIMAYEATLLAAFPDATVITGDPAHRIGWSRHPFGAHLVHYVPAYYTGVLDQLEALAGIP